MALAHKCQHVDQLFEIHHKIFAYTMNNVVLIILAMVWQTLPTTKIQGGFKSSLEIGKYFRLRFKYILVYISICTLKISYYYISFESKALLYFIIKFLLTLILFNNYREIFTGSSFYNATSLCDILSSRPLYKLNVERIWDIYSSNSWKQ